MSKQFKMRDLVNDNHQKAIARDLARAKQIKRDNVRRLIVGVLVSTILITLAIITINKYEQSFAKCDAFAGRQCTLYEARLYELKGDIK